MKTQDLDQIKTILRTLAEFNGHCRRAEQGCKQLGDLLRKLLERGTEASDMTCDIINLVDVRYIEGLRDELNDLLEYFELLAEEDESGPASPVTEAAQ
jgi:hypothetical protein